MSNSAVGGVLLNFSSISVNWLRKCKRRAVAASWPIVDDLLRSFLMVLILKPAANVLPRQSALAIAGWCGAIMLNVPTSGRSALSTMRRAFGMADADAKRAAREYLAQPFYSFVVFHRVLRRRESPNDWAVEERNNEEVTQLRESGQSFIVATGHFRRESYLALFLTRICPGSIVNIAVPVAARSLRPENIRNRVHFGQILRVIQHTRRGLKFAYVGDPSILEIAQRLGRPGCQTIVAVDAFWKKTGRSFLERPFAGMRARAFSTGSAVFSRFAQCPIVPCSSYVKSNGDVVIEWGSIIAPPCREDKDADIKTTNVMLDFLENAVGRRPTQYVLYIGDERRFDPVLGAWKDLDEKT